MSSTFHSLPCMTAYKGQTAFVGLFSRRLLKTDCAAGTGGRQREYGSKQDRQSPALTEPTIQAEGNKVTNRQFKE